MRLCRKCLRHIYTHTQVDKPVNTPDQHGCKWDQNIIWGLSTEEERHDGMYLFLVFVKSIFSSSVMGNAKGTNQTVCPTWQRVRWATYWFRLQNTTLFFYTKKNGNAVSDPSQEFSFIFRLKDPNKWFLPTAEPERKLLHLHSKSTN